MLWMPWWWYCFSRWYLLLVGGVSGLRQKLEAQDKGDFFHMMSNDDYPWTGMFFGQPIGSLWYWCMDQDIVQRTLSAKDTVHARAGCVLAAFLKILPPFLIVFPGMVAASLYPNEMEGACTNVAYPVLLLRNMPHGVVGLMIASILMALMSSLDSVFNAGSTVFTMDIFRTLIRPQASPAELLWVGRLSTAGFALASLAWIPNSDAGQC